MTTNRIVALSITTPSLLSPAGTHSGVDITVQNIAVTGYVYIGGSSELSSGNYGFRVDPSHAISVELNGRDALYALASTSGVSASVLMTNLEQGM
jgi:hypothetical protein